MADEDVSLYKVSSREIFYKNFLVGFSRAFGALVMQVIGLAFFYFLFARFVLPFVNPMLDQLQIMISQLQQFQGPPADQQQIILSPELIEQYNRSTTAPTTR